MDLKKIGELTQQLQELRNRLANIRNRELVSLAESLGRSRLPKSTKHPMYVSSLPGTRSLSIPNHPGSMPKSTARNILNQLEQDLDTWEKILGKEEENGG